MSTKSTRSEPTILTRDQILAAEDTEWRLVEVPEWGGSVWVRSLTGAERDRLEESMIRRKGGKQEVSTEMLRARLVSIATHTDRNGGGRMFSEEDIPALRRKNAHALNRVFEVAQELAGLTPGQVEELTKDLGEDPSGDSGSG